MIAGRACFLLGAAFVAAGCYNYAALRRTGVAPETYVAVTLTESGSDELARYLGPDVLVVRGRYLGSTADGLSLSVQSVESREGDIGRWAGETVVVPATFVRRLDERHAAGTKTALLAGAAVAGLVVGYRAFGPSSSGGTPRASAAMPGAH